MENKIKIEVTEESANFTPESDEQVLIRHIKTLGSWAFVAALVISIVKIFGVKFSWLWVTAPFFAVAPLCAIIWIVVWVAKGEEDDQ